MIENVAASNNLIKIMIKPRMFYHLLPNAFLMIQISLLEFIKPFKLRYDQFIQLKRSISWIS